MINRKINEVIPLIGTSLGGFAVGVFARNGFLNWTGETFAAGLLGLGGGAFALIAARNTTLRNEQKAAYRFSKNLSIKAPAILEGAISAIQEIEHREAYPEEQLPEEDHATFGYRIAMVIRSRAIREIPTPIENTPVDIQIAYDRVKTTIGVYLDPDDPNAHAVDNPTAAKWLRTFSRELGMLHVICHGYNERLSETFKQS